MTSPETGYTVLHFVQWATIISLLVVTGIAWSFNLWIIPIIKLNKSNSAVKQLTEISLRGGRWLDPTNATFALILAINAAMLSQSPRSTEATQWKTFALAAFILVQVAWWERVMIFPLEESIARMANSKAASTIMDHATMRALHQILDKWRRRHAIRATLPFVAAIVALSAKLPF